MANNRMYLVNVRTNQKVLIAKYWPSLGWTTFVAHEENATDDRQNRDFRIKFQVFFSDNDGSPSQYGPLDYRIEYEHDEGDA